MKLNTRFNTFTLPRYREAIAKHKRYTDFNPLALFRFILENGKLGEAEQLEVLALAKAAFPRFYRHLLLKDLRTYAALSRLGQEPLGNAQMRQGLLTFSLRDGFLSRPLAKIFIPSH